MNEILSFEEWKTQYVDQDFSDIIKDLESYHGVDGQEEFDKLLTLVYNDYVEYQHLPANDYI
jgi:hypothetical protein